jgi:hypothetical protein
MTFESIVNTLGSDPVFWFAALAGTGLSAIQLLFNLFGGGWEGVETSEEFDLGKFKWLSKQALTGFLMMFGWVGLTCKKELLFDLPETIACAFAAGCLSVLILGYLFKFAKTLRSPGTVFRIEDAIGQDATVYQRIPTTGTGKITVLLHNMSYELEAISQEEIPSFTQVRIVKKIDDKIVLVTPK